MAVGVEEQYKGVLEGAAALLGLRDPEYMVYLASRRHRVVGVVDIIGREEQVIVEAKATQRRAPGAHEVVQLAVYALLALSNNIAVREAVIATPTRLLARYPVDDILLSRGLRAIERTWRTITSPEPPLVSQPREKCRYCRYRNICPYPAP